MSTYLDITETAVILRGSERIAIILVAAFISYLGYKLFVKGVESQETKLEGEAPNFKLSLSGTGPGLFFMAFGAIILVFAISTKLSIKDFEEFNDQKTQNEKNEERSQQTKNSSADSTSNASVTQSTSGGGGSGGPKSKYFGLDLINTPEE